MSEHTSGGLDGRVRSLTGDIERDGASIARLEVTTDAAGTFTHLSVSLDREATEHHDALRVTIFTPDGSPYDQVVPLPASLRWFDLRTVCADHGVPLPSGIVEPGSIVRVAPYDHGSPAQSRELLALQVALDAQPGEGRFIAGRWTAEWPSSLWTAGLLTGVDRTVRRCWAVATSDLYQHGVRWRVGRLGSPGTPGATLAHGWLGGGRAAVVWEAAEFIGIDLTPDLDGIAWADLAEAELEMDAIPQDDPSARPKTMRVPLTAR
jgi:hypothetical protein